MPTITKYHLECDSDITRFNQTITRLLNDGWKLYGSPCTGTAGEADEFYFCYLQGLTKDVDS